MKLQNKTIVVTGAASGIGAEVARLARFQGATVIGMNEIDGEYNSLNYRRAYVINWGAVPERHLSGKNSNRFGQSCSG